jgi:hypothetical protein
VWSQHRAGVEAPPEKRASIDGKLPREFSQGGGGSNPADFEKNRRNRSRRFHSDRDFGFLLRRPGRAMSTAAALAAEAGLPWSQCSPQVRWSSDTRQMLEYQRTDTQPRTAAAGDRRLDREDGTAPGSVDSLPVRLRPRWKREMRAGTKRSLDGGWGQF